MKSHDKVPHSEIRPNAPKNTDAPKNTNPLAVKSAEAPVADKKKPRWDETRGLLQQALADWEVSEKKAEEALKTAETQKLYIDDLMKELKAKLDEFSS